MRKTLSLTAAACLLGAAFLGVAPAQAATATSQSLLGGKLVESWGACEMPGGWLTVHHDGWTSAGAAIGMRLFQGTDADAVVTRTWGRASPSGRVPDRHDCVSADFDGNGLVDFYVTAGRGSRNETKENGRGNELWLQTSVGVWVNRAAEWGVEDVCGRSHYAATADFNGDNRPDVYVGNAAPRAVTPDPCDAVPGSEDSHLYLNVDGTHFRDATAEWGLSGNAGVRCAYAGKFIGDARPDLVVCRPTGLLVLENLGGRFVDRRAAFGIAATSWAQAAVGDVTRDAVPDLVTATGSTVSVRAGFTGAARTVLTSSYIRGVAVNPQGDIYVVRANLSGHSNPQDVVLVRGATGWTKAWVPNAVGVGDFALWLPIANGWLVGNGLENSLGPLQLVRTTA